MDEKDKKELLERYSDSYKTHSPKQIVDEYLNEQSNATSSKSEGSRSVVIILITFMLLLLCVPTLLRLFGG